MSSPLSLLALKEYRCTCGKLLFRGTLFLSTVEVKCKRCSSVRIFDDAASGRITFTLFIDTSGVVIDMCRIAEALGIEKDAYQGREASSIFPVLRDTPFLASPTEVKEAVYHIPSSALMCRDGNTLEVESSIMPYYKEDTLDGFRIFNVLHGP